MSVRSIWGVARAVAFAACVASIGLAQAQTPFGNCANLSALCGPGNPCANGACCSQWGFCGLTDGYCGVCCQSNCQAGQAAPQFQRPPTPQPPTPQPPTQSSFEGLCSKTCSDEFLSGCVSYQCNALGMSDYNAWAYCRLEIDYGIGPLVTKVGCAPGCVDTVAMAMAKQCGCGGECQEPPQPAPVPVQRPAPVPVQPAPVSTSIPTAQPTTFDYVAGPTSEPTLTPTPNPLPQHSLAHEKDDFMLKIYWQESYLWQGTRNETFWCMECGSSDCNEGDEIKVHECDENNMAQRWQRISVADGVSRIKTTGRNLCLTTPTKFLNLTRCDENDDDQLFEGILDNGDRFEWTSYGENLLYERCITPHHHPRAGEMIFKEKCVKARQTKSSFWVVWKPSSVSRLGNYNGNSCSTENPCGECAGDCDDDSGCAGNLQCFQRNAYEPVAGCSGMGKDGWDYCVLPPGENEFDDQIYDYDGGDFSTALVSSGGTGCRGSVCTVCEGDCDDDNDCGGTMKCFQRENLELVPGCSGVGKRGWDYCYIPSKVFVRDDTIDGVVVIDGGDDDDLPRIRSGLLNLSSYLYNSVKDMMMAMTKEDDGNGTRRLNAPSVAQ